MEAGLAVADSFERNGAQAALSGGRDIWRLAVVTCSDC
jgi:hypothetical protein